MTQTRFPALSLMLLCCAAPAQANDDLLARLTGTYSAVNGDDYTCAENPVRLGFSNAPPHAFFDWPLPRKVFDGSTRTGVTYDIVDVRPDGLWMRLEGDSRRTDDGKRPIWILRPNPTYDGFCWGRADWPLVRCENQHQRCGEAPIS